MGALVTGATEKETITQLRNALSVGAWHLQECIDNMDNDLRWHEDHEQRTRLLAVAQMLQTSARPRAAPVILKPVSKSAAQKRQEIVKRSCEPHNHKRKYDSLEDDDILPQEAACDYTVKCIHSRTGWYVDHVELEYDNGSFERHGNSLGGAKTRRDTLYDGETITEVAQQGWSYGHLGSALIFKLSSGREIKINGSSGQKN